MSPMTAYYLRKLIHSHQSQLTGGDLPSCDLSSGPQQEGRSSFSKMVHDRIRDMPYPTVLEKLVTLHKTLQSSPRIHHDEIQRVELQIYQLLGLRQKEGSSPCADPIEGSRQRTTTLLKRLHQKISGINSRMDYRVTLHYLHYAYSLAPSVLENLLPDSQKSKADHHQLDCLWRWGHVFCRQWDLMRPTFHAPTEPISEASSAQDLSPLPINRDWHELFQLVRLASRISTNPQPKRSRDLVKILNAVSCKSAEHIGDLRTRYYLLESRPETEWCHMFMISDVGSTTYCGNIRAIITRKNLQTFEAWMQKFWQLCQANQDDLLLKSS